MVFEYSLRLKRRSLLRPSLSRLAASMSVKSPRNPGGYLLAIVIRLKAFRLQAAYCRILSDRERENQSCRSAASWSRLCVPDKLIFGFLFLLAVTFSLSSL